MFKRFRKLGGNVAALARAWRGCFSTSLSTTTPRSGKRGYEGERPGCVWLFPILAAMASLAAQAAPMTVTLGTLAPDGTSYHRMLLEMREKWRKAPGGGVNLRIYAGGKMGGESKMVSQMRQSSSRGY